MGRSILAVLVATILAISRVSINPTLPQGRVPQCLPYLCSTPALLPTCRRAWATVVCAAMLQ